MGQRHMTYIYVYDENGVEGVGALYNQWNHATIQPPKIIRFEKQLAKWKKNEVHFPHTYYEWTGLYERIASISDTTTDIGFSNEMEQYNENYGMYDEDNNDGWQFIVIKVDSKDKYKPVQVTYGFKPEATGKFLNLYQNIMQDDKSTSDDYKLHKIENYLKDFNKTEQKILEKINESFDRKILKQAEMRIKYHIAKSVLNK